MISLLDGSMDLERALESALFEQRKSSQLQTGVPCLEILSVAQSTEKINRLQVDNYHCLNDVNLVATHVKFL